MITKLQLPPLANEQIFEDFTLDLFNQDYSGGNFQLFGKKGNKQKGIDIIDVRSGIAIQCKLKEHKRSGVLKELERDFSADLERAINAGCKIQQLIFVSTFDDNAYLIEYLQTLKQSMNLPFDVTYLGWQSLCAKLQTHFVLQKKYFPQYFVTKGTFFTPVPFFDIHQLLDKDELLQKLKELAAKYRISAIQGLGGVGKTVALSCWLNENKDHYDHIIWADCSLASVKDSILGCSPFESTRKQGLKVTEQWNNFCKELLKIKGKNLMVIDGIEQSEDEIYNIIEDVAATGWQVILTSRIKLADYPVIELNGLTAESAITLFNRYYTKQADRQLLAKVINVLDGHPLLVELVAKAGNANRRMSLQKLHAILEESNIRAPELQRKINVGRHSRKYTNERHQNIYNYLLLCFDISNLSKPEQIQLLYMSVFPVSQPVNIDSFIELTQQQKKKSDSIGEALNKLEAYGWIAYRDGAYFIHPLIQAVVWKKLAISAKKIQSLIIGCTGKLANATNPWLLVNEIAISKNVLQATELTIESLYLNLVYGTALTKMGNYTTAISHFKQCEKFAGQNFIAEPNFLSDLFNNLGNAYRLAGSYKEAGDYLLMAIQIKQISDNDDPISMAKSMDNYASVLEAMGRYKESAAISKNVIKIFKEEKALRDLSQAYINIASTYYHMQKYKLAKMYWKKGHQLLPVDADSELVSSSFNTLGIILQAQNHYRFAKTAFLKGIKAHKDSPNPDILALLYTNLSSVEFCLQQFEKGKINLLKAKKLNEKIEGGYQLNKARWYELNAQYNIREKNYEEVQKNLRNALNIYEKIFEKENNNHARIKEELNRLSTGIIYEKAEDFYANNLFYAIKEYMHILHKQFRLTIDEYGAVKGPRIKNDKDFVHDYIFFCATKSCKSYAAVIALMDKNKAEDALVLLYAIYRNYLLIERVNSDSRMVSSFISVPIQVNNGSVKRVMDNEGIIDAMQIIDTDNNKRPLYPDLSLLVKTSSYPENKIVHNYIGIQLSDHVYANFMTSGNYRDSRKLHYTYNKSGIIVQPLLIGTYLLILLIQEVLLFVADNSDVNNRTKRFMKECVPLVISLIQLGNLEVAIKDAMINRLKNSIDALHKSVEAK